MTQELAVGTLLAGFLGIVWVMAVAVIHGDEVSKQNQDQSHGTKPEPPSSSQRKTLLAA